MSTAAQIAANQSNAVHSTGPLTEAGKQISARNNFRHGLAAGQLLIQGESPEDYNALREAFIQDQQPATFLERTLVDSMAEHYWLWQRAIRFQNAALDEDDQVNQKKLSLFMRYQTTNERAFHQSLNVLLKLRASIEKERIGFESQKREEALNAAKINALNAKTAAIEIDTEIRTTIEAPLPGNQRLLFETLKPALQSALREFRSAA